MAVYGGAPTFSSQNGICTWYGWGGVAAAALTLYVTAAVTTSGEPGTYNNAVVYSLDNGSTWTDLLRTYGNASSATYTAAIPAGQNLANVQVKASSFSSVPHTGQQVATSSITVSNLHIA